MHRDTVDAMRYALHAMSGGGWGKLLLRTKIYAYRGREVRFVAVTSAEMCKPWCGVCQRPVDRATVDETLNVARVKAFCHGSLEVVDVPWAYVRSGQRFELGIAFWSGPQPRSAA